MSDYEIVPVAIAPVNKNEKVQVLELAAGDFTTKSVFHVQFTDASKQPTASNQLFPPIWSGDVAFLREKFSQFLGRRIVVASADQLLIQPLLNCYVHFVSPANIVRMPQMGKREINKIKRCEVHKDVPRQCAVVKLMELTRSLNLPGTPQQQVPDFDSIACAIISIPTLSSTDMSAVERQRANKAAAAARASKPPPTAQLVNQTTKIMQILDVIQKEIVSIKSDLQLRPVENTPGARFATYDQNQYQFTSTTLANTPTVADYTYNPPNYQQTYTTHTNQTAPVTMDITDSQTSNTFNQSIIDELFVEPQHPPQEQIYLEDLGLPNFSTSFNNQYPSNQQTTWNEQEVEIPDDLSYPIY